jgi:hypothetical protein
MDPIPNAMTLHRDRYSFGAFPYIRDLEILQE